MLKNPLMESLRKGLTKEEQAQIDDSFALADRIAYLLKKHKISQKQLAQKLQKRESEISKWLSGGHNFTQHTLTKISIAIGESIYQIPAVENEAAIGIDSLHIFKTIFSKIFELKNLSKTGFENYSGKEISTLSVDATGIICKSDLVVERAKFLPAHIQKSAFKNIEKAIS